MSARKLQKAQTRRALLEAALSQMGTDRDFASLSLREVARAAGIAPTSFYRHFRDLEELGISLVEGAAGDLRERMRWARREVDPDIGMVRASVNTFMEYLNEHASLRHILLRERAVGTPAFRSAVKNAIEGFVDDLSEDLKRVNEERGTPIGDIRLVAETLVTLVLDGGTAALEGGPEGREAVAERLVTQLRMVVLGAQTMANARSTWTGRRIVYKSIDGGGVTR